MIKPPKTQRTASHISDQWSRGLRRDAKASKESEVRINAAVLAPIETKRNYDKPWLMTAEVQEEIERKKERDSQRKKKMEMELHRKPKLSKAMAEQRAYRRTLAGKSLHSFIYGSDSSGDEGDEPSFDNTEVVPPKPPVVNPVVYSSSLPRCPMPRLPPRFHQTPVDDEFGNCFRSRRQHRSMGEDEVKWQYHIGIDSFDRLLCNRPYLDWFQCEHKPIKFQRPAYVPKPKGPRVISPVPDLVPKVCRKVRDGREKMKEAGLATESFNTDETVQRLRLRSLLSTEDYADYLLDEQQRRLASVEIQ